MSKYVYAILCIALSGIFSFFWALPRPMVPSEISAMERQSIAVIRTADGICSGWVLRGRHRVVTAAHCLSEDGKKTIDPVSVSIGGGIPSAFVPAWQGDAHASANPDIAVLQPLVDVIHWPPGFNVCHFAPYPGEATHLYGVPLNHAVGYSAGYIASQGDNLSGRDDGQFFATLMRYDGMLYPGQSGGPLLDNMEGCVMGIAELNLTEIRDGITFSFPFFTPAHYLYEIKALTNAL